jgi:AcrR family transcriptional regulator
MGNKPLAVQPEADGAPLKRERRDAVENRRRLLAAAKTLFAAEGVEQTTMQAVAQAAGVGQGTLYRHFADKGALCQALIAEDLERFRERLAGALDDAATSPLARLELLITEKNLLTEGHLQLFAAMEGGGPAGRGGKRRRGPFHHWLHERIVRLLDAAVAQGEAAPLDAPFTADALLAAVAPPLYRGQREELGYSRERIDAAMRRLFVEGLRLGRRADGARAPSGGEAPQT